MHENFPFVQRSYLSLAAQIHKFYIVTPAELDRSEGPSLGPSGPQGPVDLDFYFFMGFLGVRSGPMTFLTLLPSFLVLESLKTVG